MGTSNRLVSVCVWINFWSRGGGGGRGKGGEGEGEERGWGGGGGEVGRGRERKGGGTCLAAAWLKELILVTVLP